MYFASQILDLATNIRKVYYYPPGAVVHRMLLLNFLKEKNMMGLKLIYGYVKSNVYYFRSENLFLSTLKKI